MGRKGKINTPPPPTHFSVEIQGEIETLPREEKLSAADSVRENSVPEPHGGPTRMVEGNSPTVLRSSQQSVAEGKRGKRPKIPELSVQFGHVLFVP